MKAQSVTNKKGHKAVFSKYGHKANGSVPRGGEEIKEAILKATEKLLAKHNPTEISLRQIATAANVNHSLIHRYFRTKDSVILAVHGRIIEKLGQQFSGIETLDGNIEKLFKISKENPSRRILLARAMLDGADPQLIRHHFPTVHQLMHLLKKKKSEVKNPTKFDAETLAAFFVASVMGWFLYEPFLLASTGLDKKSKDKVHHQIIQMLEKMAEHLI